MFFSSFQVATFLQNVGNPKYVIKKESGKKLEHKTLV